MGYPADRDEYEERLFVARKTIETLQAAERELIEKNTELERLFELQHKRMGEATELWRKDTGRHDVLPDLGDLLTHLLGRIKAGDQAVEILQTGLAQETIALMRARAMLSPTHKTLSAIEQAIVQAFLQDETATNRGAVITRAALLVLAALQNLAGVPTSARGQPPDSGSGQPG